MILCSSGVLFRPETFDADAILEFGPQLPADGIEVLVTKRMVGRLDEVADRLNSSELRFPVVHGPKRLGAALPTPEAVEQLEEAARFATAIGADLVVLHLWDLPESDGDLDGRLEAAVLAADVLDHHGCRLSVETIPCIHATPLANIERVLEREPRATVTLDTEFLAYHDEIGAALDAGWLWRDGVVRNIHVKDYARGLADEDGVRRYLLPGEGAIDFPALFQALNGLGYSGTVALEAPSLQSDGRPDVPTLARSLRRMSHHPWAFQ